MPARRWTPVLLAALILLVALLVGRPWEGRAPGGDGVRRSGGDDAAASPPALAGAPVPPQVATPTPATVPEDGPLPPAKPGERLVVLRVTIDGKATLPASWSLRAGRDAFLRIGQVRSGPVETDRATSEIRFRMSPPAREPEIRIWFHAEGTWPVETIARAKSDDGPFVAEVVAETAGTIVVRTSPEEPFPMTLQVAKLDTEGAWVGAPGPPGYHGIGASRDGETWTFGPLLSGRYRVFDSESGVATEPVDVVPGRPPPEVRLDLSPPVFVSGRVRVPATEVDLASLEDVRVHVEGPGVLHLFPAPVGADGSFSIPVPGDRAVTLRPWHPVLVPAKSGGTAIVTGARDGVVLDLVAGAWCAMRPAPAPVLRPWLPRPRAFLFAGEPEGAPAETHDVTFRAGMLRFGGFAPGRWTLWVDLPGFAPLVRREVDLAAGGTDLGEVPLEAGASVRVRVLFTDGADPPPVIVHAERLDPPVYSRITEAKPDPFVVLSGLGPGRFRVEALDKGAERRVQQEIVVEGTEGANLTLDLR